MEVFKSTSASVLVLPQRGGVQFSGVNVNGGQSGGDGVLPNHGDDCDHHGEVWQSRAQQTDVSKSDVQRRIFFY